MFVCDLACACVCIELNEGRKEEDEEAAAHARGSKFAGDDDIFFTPCACSRARTCARAPLASPTRVHVPCTAIVRPERFAGGFFETAIVNGPHRQ